MKTDLRWTLLAAALLGACGGDDDDGGTAGAAGTSASGTGGTSASGAGGTGASGSGGSASGTGGTSASGAAGTASGHGGTASGASGHAGASAGSAGSAPGGAAGTGGSAGTTGGSAGANGGSAGANGGSAGNSGGAGGAAGSASGAAGSSGGSAGSASGAAGSASGAAGSASGASGASGAAGSGQSSAACPGLVPGATGHVTGQTLKVGSLDRTYSLDVPAALDPAKKYPLVFVFHGDGGTGEAIRPGYSFASIAGSDAIFVYPDATADSGRSFDVSHADNIDLDFFDALTTSLEASYCVDPAHVFAAGMSRGGFFSNWLGCQRGNKLRAIAPHSGSIYSEDDDVEYTDAGTIECPTPAPPAILFHGQSDSVVPFTDGQYALSEWVAGNSCGKTTKAYDPSPCVSYDGCQAGHPVVWCAIPGLGHDIWPKAPQATWDFFKSML